MEKNKRMTIHLQYRILGAYHNVNPCRRDMLLQLPGLFPEKLSQACTNSSHFQHMEIHILYM